ncbi:uncharacterized protein K460DRAFT_410962 [Cucurbitaria berberidis CBS 394.84]|uniref:DUF7730 domain-containing protein n=1 Tax=Cucurbitaria berberidis CBS 394.84 TaxID=1168544 RepID=A0A9P4G7Y1_9PLEO|nr:uncharacterized protein K460DRAFT_410962 [Cucurbitaria berberidis CBS 394.84]KAF1840370.1 hypothetical protein K460DRAFT_410962 [Cucurbitaria berberidis CBS 394.84]
MASRKKESSPVLRTPRALQAKSAKSKVTKAAGIGKKKSRTSGLAQKNQSIPVVSLENGLVSMEKTPENLVGIVKRNASNSPLLRLPGEIRNHIWALAMGGHYIKIEEVVYRKTTESLWMKTTYRAPANIEDRICPPSAFRFPEVCRQIYSETATLGYKLNTFVFDHYISYNSKWMARLLPGQKSAITSVVLESVMFEGYVANISVGSLRLTLPNLKRIEVPRNALSLVMVFNRAVDPTGLWTSAQWREWVVGEVKKKEGNDIEVSFHDEHEVYCGDEGAEMSS